MVLQTVPPQLKLTENGQEPGADSNIVVIGNVTLPRPADIRGEWVRVYEDLLKAAADELAAFPGFTTVHILMAERIAHAYCRQRSYETDPLGEENVWYIQKMHQDQFRGLLKELYAEARAMSRQDVWQKNFVDSVLHVLRDELSGSPDLLRAIMIRFKDMAA